MVVRFRCRGYQNHTEHMYIFFLLCFDKHFVSGHSFELMFFAITSCSYKKSLNPPRPQEDCMKTEMQTIMRIEYVVLINKTDYL
jgi:hypothetical protein